MQVIKPCLKYKDAYMAYIYEVKCYNEENRLGESMLKENEEFEKMLTRVDNISNSDISKDKTTTVYWMIDNEEVVGSMNLRHALNERTYFTIGNIGYYVKPSSRNKGYATAALSFAKKFYKDLGLSKILLICYDNNVASQKVIIKNGGIFELEIKDFKTSNYLRRYWIEL